MLSLLLLGGVTADRLAYHVPGTDPGPYHERVKNSIQAIPMTIGDWQGADNEVPSAATELLRPNTILGRRYVNRKQGIAVSLLIVHCTDARDIQGHYPPVCYPANGMEAARGGARVRTWRVGGLEIPGMEYVFYSGEFRIESGIVVQNFILRPDGRIDRDMNRIDRVAYDPRLRHFGGGQVQLVFDSSVPEDLRDRTFEEIISACLPAIRTVLDGVHND